MRIFRENIVSPDNLIVVKEERFKYNDFPFHFHPEYEIILILESTGQRIVGDSITEYEAVDLCMFGSNLPHTFFTRGLSNNEAVRQVVIQFHENFLGPGFFDRGAFKTIKELLQRSSRGIVFDGATRQKLVNQIIALCGRSPAEKIIGLLEILNTLSLSEDYTLLSSPGFMQTIAQDSTNRMSAVYDYILQNYKRDITLDEVAAMAYLSPSAFCRYFKKFTRKTLSEFMIDLRIGHACKLLQNNNTGIQQVSMEVGFNNVSYFNRKFKATKGITPMEYQRQFAARQAR